MPDPLTDALAQRVLLLPPTRRDGAAAAAVFDAAGIALTLCDDIASLCSEIARGAAVAIVPEEAILNDKDGCLAGVLTAQPSWSDFPLVVLTGPEPTAAAARALEAVGHMTLLPRPVAIASLVSTVQAALRDRRRQYARRDEFVERERQAEALRAADRQKDEFLAMLAHELRNPLAAVSHAVSALRLSPDSETRDWAGEVVERQVRQLVRLIDDLLDVSRINSGKIRIKKEYVDAAAVLDAAVESARPLIDERGQTLTQEIERGGLPVHVDPTRVGQIVLNLLTNAAKYTDRGGRIHLSARREGNEVVVGVRDNGIGIAPEKLPEMFGLFAQGDRSLARSEGGLGIGLTIVQKLAELHGGSVTARSEGPGRGSEFVVRLPLAGAAVKAAAQAEPGRSTGRNRSRVLVVDDNVDTALGLARLLGRLGHEVSAVHDGPAAVAAARGFRPDVVLLDIGLPGMDGYRVASALRSEPALKDAVIVAVTGYGQAADRKRSQAAGFDHHLVKPVDLDVLLPLLGRSG